MRTPRSKKDAAKNRLRRSEMGQFAVCHAVQMLSCEKVLNKIAEQTLGEFSFKCPPGSSINVPDGEFFQAKPLRMLEQHLNSTGQRHLYTSADPPVGPKTRRPLYKVTGDGATLSRAGKGTGGVDQVMATVQHLGDDGRQPLTGEPILTHQADVNIMLVAMVLHNETARGPSRAFPRARPKACARQRERDRALREIERERLRKRR